MLERYRLPFQMAVDLAAWAAGLYFAMVLRFESFVPQRLEPLPPVAACSTAIAIAAVLQAVSGLALGLYLGRWRFGTLDEVSHLVGSVAITIAGPGRDRPAQRSPARAQPACPWPAACSPS